MRIALLQLNARLGDPEANGRALERAYGEGVRGGAELVLTPELAVPGYLAEDRMWEPGLWARVEAESRRPRWLRSHPGAGSAGSPRPGRSGWSGS